MKPLDQAVPQISIVMPIYNGAEFLPKSLPPLTEMVKRSEIVELLIVDDGSTDDSIEIAKSFGAKIMSTNGRMGPGAARNMAAEVAQGEVLWFIDADVVVHEDTARIMANEFATTDISAVFGSYDNKPPADNFLSQYKNLVHHYYHQRANKIASTFWSGCGAIKRDVFLELGGFDIEMFKHPSIEDIELGYRVIAAGGKIHLLVEMQCTHLKVWRFVNLIHTEFFRRALPWSRLMINRSGLVNDLNVGPAERIKAVIAGLFVLVALAVIAQVLPLWVFGLSSLIVVAVHWQLAECFYQRKGLLFSLGGLIYHQFYYIYSSVAFVWALAESRFALAK